MAKGGKSAKTATEAAIPADEEGDITADEAATRLERLARLIRQSGHAEGLLPTHWEVLRYLARASRFSRSAGAVAQYLCTTKGTMSQTLQTLEKKGLIVRNASSPDSRPVTLSLSPAGNALLLKDPLQALAADIATLGGKTRKRLGRGLADLLLLEVTRQGAQIFGICSDCRYFRERGSDDAMTCMKDGKSLRETETRLLCIEHVDR
jgi:DNA-binding MarR family transcriptional regulator